MDPSISEQSLRERKPFEMSSPTPLYFDQLIFGVRKIDLLNITLISGEDHFSGYLSGIAGKRLSSSQSTCQMSPKEL